MMSAVLLFVREHDKKKIGIVGEVIRSFEMYHIEFWGNGLLLPTPYFDILKMWEEKKSKINKKKANKMKIILGQLYYDIAKAVHIL